MSSAPPLAIAPAQRRHTDPPTLWVLVLAGSVLLHLFLMLFIRLSAQQTETIQWQPTPVAVEFVDPTVESASASTSPPSSSPRLPESTMESVSTPAPLTSSTANPEITTVPPTAPAANNPILSKPPALDRESDRPSTPQLPPPSSAPTQSPVSTAPQPTTPPLLSPSPSPTEPSEPTTSGSRLPDLPAIASQPIAQPDKVAPIPDNPIPIPDPTPARFVATIAVSAPTDIPDIPDYPPTLNGATQQEFSSDASGSGCLLKPDALPNFDQPIEFRIVVDANGNVAGEPTLLRSSGNSSYDQLAGCAIQSWQFEPAYDVKDGAKSVRLSNLDVQIAIGRAVVK